MTVLLNAASSASFKCFRQISVRSVDFLILFSCSIKCVCDNVRSNLAMTFVRQTIRIVSVFPRVVSLVYAGRHVDQVNYSRDAVSLVIPTSQVLSGSFADSETLDGGLFLGHAESGLVGLGDLLGLLVAVELNVRVGGEVGRDATMGSVGSSTAGNGALDNGVVDNASVNIELGGLSVSSKVDEELTASLKGLLGPSTLGVLEFLALSVTSNTSGESAEGDNLLVLETVLVVLNGSVQLHALDGASRLVCVLEVSSQVRNSAFSS